MTDLQSGQTEHFQAKKFLLKAESSTVFAIVDAESILDISVSLCFEPPKVSLYTEEY